jgi:hypothetical protein
MGELSANDMPYCTKLRTWVRQALCTPPLPKIDVRITTFKTEEAVDVLMVIKIDDDKN